MTKDSMIQRLEKTAAILAQWSGHRVPPGTDFRSALEDSPEGVAWSRALAIFEAVEGHPPQLEERYTASALRNELASIILHYGDGNVFFNTPDGPAPVTGVDVTEDRAGSILITLEITLE